MCGQSKSRLEEKNKIKKQFAFSGADSIRKSTTKRFH
jgi:hypothetical protein